MKIWRIVIGILLLLCFEIHLLYFVKQSDFFALLLDYTGLFIVYCFLFYSCKEKLSNKFIFSLFFATRVVGLFAFPMLSDDIYRFWWDGYFNLQGFNPFQYKPNELIALHPEYLQDASIKSIYSHLNSPEYYSVYPAICQFLFLIAAKISSTNIALFAIVLKVIFTTIDFIIVFYLKKLLDISNKSNHSSLLYILNPLILIEIHGNLHFEILILLGLCLSLYFLFQNSFFKSGIWFGVSIIGKLTSGIFAPIFITFIYLKQARKATQFVAALTLSCIFFFLYPGKYYSNFLQSIRLYFKQFEFNSFLFRPIHNFLFEHNLHELNANLGFTLSFCFIIILFTLIILVFRNKITLFKALWICQFFYLLCSSTVHPWYISSLILLGVFAYPITSISWSFLIMLSYIKYDSMNSSYLDTFVLIEYFLLLIIFILEVRISNKL
jgi:alpha-1,6-mannosyltransferase